MAEIVISGSGGSDGNGNGNDNATNINQMGQDDNLTRVNSLTKQIDHANLLIQNQKIAMQDLTRAFDKLKLAVGDKNLLDSLSKFRDGLKTEQTVISKSTSSYKELADELEGFVKTTQALKYLEREAIREEEKVAERKKKVQRDAEGKTSSFFGFFQDIFRDPLGMIGRGIGSIFTATITKPIAEAEQAEKDRKELLIKEKYNIQNIGVDYKDILTKKVTTQEPEVVQPLQKVTGIASGMRETQTATPSGVFGMSSQSPAQSGIDGGRSTSAFAMSNTKGLPQMSSTMGGLTGSGVVTPNLEDKNSVKTSHTGLKGLLEFLTKPFSTPLGKFLKGDKKEDDKMKIQGDKKADGNLMMMAIKGIAISLLWAVVDGIQGYFKAKEWGVSKVSGFLGAFLGGTGSGFSNAFVQAGKWAIMGAGIGFLAGGPVGAIVGGLIGASIGFILGFIGGEKIAKGIESSLTGPLSKLWKDNEKNIAQKLVGSLSIVFDSLWNGFQNFYAAIPTMIASIFTKDQGKLGLVSKVAKGFLEFINAFNPINMVRNYISLFRESIDRVFQSKNLLEGAINIGRLILDVFFAPLWVFLKMAGDAVKGVMKMLSPLERIPKLIFDNIISPVFGFFKMVGETVVKVISKINPINFVKGFFDGGKTGKDSKTVSPENFKEGQDEQFRRVDFDRGASQKTGNQVNNVYNNSVTNSSVVNGADMPPIGMSAFVGV